LALPEGIEPYTFLPAFIRTALEAPGWDRELDRVVATTPADIAATFNMVAENLAYVDVLAKFSKAAIRPSFFLAFPVFMRLCPRFKVRVVF
jgi:hypothetical protein